MSIRHMYVTLACVYRYAATDPDEMLDNIYYMGKKESKSW